MLQNALKGEHSAILLTCIKTFVFSIFEWMLKTGFTVDIIFSVVPMFSLNM